LHFLYIFFLIYVFLQNKTTFYLVFFINTGIIKSFLVSFFIKKNSFESCISSKQNHVLFSFFLLPELSNLSFFHY